MRWKSASLNARGSDRMSKKARRRLNAELKARVAVEALRVRRRLPRSGFWR
jgi:hypothetical protein